MSTKTLGQVFNLIIAGFGYINRIREVAPQGAQPYLCADVALMEGVAQDGDYSQVGKTRISCSIKGRAAKEIIRRHFTGPDGQVTSPKAPVVASMQLGGLQPDTFTYQKGERAGEVGVSLRSSLLKITWMKIGDTVVDLGQGNQEVPEAAQAAEGTDAVPANETGEPAFADELHAEYGARGFIRLDPEDPDFQAQKAFLKERGFRWNGAEKCWTKAAA